MAQVIGKLHGPDGGAPAQGFPDVVGKAVAVAGRIVLIGTGTGKTADATFGVLGALMKDATMYGMSLINAGSAVPEMAATLTRLFAERKIKAVVSKTYSLSDAPLALSDLLAGNVFGKLVLTP